MDEFSPADRPAFLKRETAESLPYVGAGPDDPPRFDDELIPEDPLAPSRGIINRYREIARRNALGQTNNEICQVLGYTPSRLSIILKDPFVQQEIAVWRDRLIDDDTMGILKNSAKDGARRIQAMINDPKAKDTLVLDASKFAIEKVTGKARQEVTVESGTLSTFMEMLKEMRQRGEAIDVTPAPALAGGQVTETAEAPQQEDKFTAWLDQNL